MHYYIIDVLIVKHKSCLVILHRGGLDKSGKWPHEVISLCPYIQLEWGHEQYSVEWTTYKVEDKQTNTAKLNWLVHNVGSYGEIEHSSSNLVHVAWFK